MYDILIYMNQVAHYTAKKGEVVGARKVTVSHLRALSERETLLVAESKKNFREGRTYSTQEVSSILTKKLRTQ
jgi:hypothetical protein